MSFKTYHKLKVLPLGSIQPKGWVKEQLQRNRDGMGGHMDELEHDMLWGPYTEFKGPSCWQEDLAAGWGAEISGNFWYGEVLLAFSLQDEALIKKCENWVNTVLKNQRADGYMGAFTEKDNQMQDFNAWGTNVGMKAMLAYYDATGRKDVLEAVHKCMLWFCDNWAGSNKTRYAGSILLESMELCYQRVGDERILTFMNEYIDFMERNDVHRISRSAMLDSRLDYTSMHAAGFANILWTYTAAYKAGGDKLNLQAAENGFKKLKEKALHRTGGISCYAEYLAPTGSAVETEYCSFSYLTAAMLQLAEATGNPMYVDELERIVFNGAQGARKKDEKAIAYLTSPNQIYATVMSSYASNHNQLYSPCYPTACCPTTSMWVMPNYLRTMALQGEDGLYLSAYGPATIRCVDFTLEEDTQYPFRDTVTFTFRAEKPVETTLQFRVPQWCTGMELAVNGEAVTVTAAQGEYQPICRTWQDGDTVTLRLPMAVGIFKIDDADCAGKFPMAFEYGPLLFSLHIPEKWTEVPGIPNTPLPEGWHWYKVTPPNTNDERADPNEREGFRKFKTCFNVAVDETLRPEDVQVELCQDAGYVWETPQVKLRVPGYKALLSYPPYLKKTIDPYFAPMPVHGELELELVPHGCTNLRITYFPRAKLPMEDLHFNCDKV